MRRLLCILGLAGAGTLVPGCQDPIVRVRHEVHPPGGHYLVSGTIEPFSGGYYSAAVTIRNTTDQPLDLDRSSIRIDGTPPTVFVPADSVPVYIGNSLLKLPTRIASRGSAQGDVFFSIRGTDKPHGPVRLVIALPDGEHTFEFEFLE